MPELPEVEVVRRDLAAIVTGRRISAVHATNPRVLRHAGDTHHFERALRGRRIEAVGRHGKNLLVGLDDGATLVVHLGMSGQLRHAPRPRHDVVAKHTHAVLRITGAGEIRYVDPRTFGELFVVPAGVVPLAHLGPDALEALSLVSFRELLATRRVQLKALLMDQRRIAGLGNIYSDEALFAARLRWNRSSATVTARQAGALHGAIRSILVDAIEQGGSSLSDRQYVDVHGRTGNYATRHRVYDRTGQPCVRCGTPIERARWGGRSTFFCPSCQT